MYWEMRPEIIGVSTPGASLGLLLVMVLLVRECKMLGLSNDRDWKLYVQRKTHCESGAQETQPSENSGIRTCHCIGVVVVKRRFG